MKPQRSEIFGRMVSFLDLDSDGLRRTVLESILEAQEFTVASLHEIVSRRLDVSKKAIASMIGRPKPSASVGKKRHRLHE